MKNKNLHGINVLITAGPTREYIDPVRYLSNDSSGIMGFSLATVAKKMGANVTLISGPINPPSPPFSSKGGSASGGRKGGVGGIINVISAREMFQAVKKNYRSADIIIMAAAVSDFRPAKFSRSKIKKSLRLTTYSLQLINNPDILEWLGDHKRLDQVLVGFALETKDLIKNAQKKLMNKKCDMIIANYSSAIGRYKSAARILTRKGVEKNIARRSKSDIARAIFSQISKQLTGVSCKL